jgi:hypothetical protein
MNDARISHAAYTYHPLRPSMLTLLREMDGAMNQVDDPVNYKRREFLAKVELLKPRMLELHAQRVSVPKMAVELGMTYSSAYEALQECKRQARIK